VAPSHPCVPHPPADSDAPGVIPIHIDITDPWCVEASAAIANDVTLLINNAGMASSATLLGGSIDDVRAPMESHFFGTLSVTRTSAPHLIANAPRAVLNVVSVLCWLHPSMLGAYAATKTALWAQTDVVREEFEPRRLGDGPAHRIHRYRHGRGYRRRESGLRHHRRHSVGSLPVRALHMHRQTTIRFAAPNLRTQLVTVRLPPPACGCGAFGRRARII